MGDADQRSTNLPPADGGETPTPEPSSRLEPVTPEESLTELEAKPLMESAHLPESDINPCPDDNFVIAGGVIIHQNDHLIRTTRYGTNGVIKGLGIGF